MKPLSFEKLQELDIITDFNEIHGTSLTWSSYFDEIGMTGTECADDRKKEYEHYVRWVKIQNTPLMKALR